MGPETLKEVRSASEGVAKGESRAQRFASGHAGVVSVYMLEILSRGILSSSEDNTSSESSVDSESSETAVSVSESSVNAS